MSETKNVISKRLLLGIIVASAIIAVAFCILLMLNRIYDSGLPVDETLFGTYGDFVGGVIGTIVALYSAYLLVRTFENQASANADNRKVNESVVRANNAAIVASQMEGYLNQLGRFDSLFNSLLSSYLKALDSYKYKDDAEFIQGRNAFERLTENFINTNFENKNEYQRRCYAAVEEYVDFYAHNRTQLSVHLRLLYLAVSFIAESELEEDDKVRYAKLIRGQMSDAEMLIVRYNCLSDYGKKMREYCNTFNLTKHVPIMHLLEFKKYYTHLQNKLKEKGLDNTLPELVGGLEAMFIVLRKQAGLLLLDKGTHTELYKTNKRYSVKMTVNAGHRLVEVSFIKNSNVNRVGGGYRLQAAEKALDEFDDDLLVNLFFDFYHEVFGESNFHLYNHDVKLEFKKNREEIDGVFSFVINITNNKSLVLSKQQADRRDNLIELQPYDGGNDCGSVS
ncbi:MAG: putative phage abortive infection protein [Bacteroidales bacterium]|nr:putative phage abortive infection protein [Bacteroidales bacterium]